ncbi:hypothetical protein [uncultured Paludibaculum sp.]|uniref:hypothetical protein n=1 Tax=uncultured Paludibaculum sp. TaxID=1765020 RepID=UPI002AAB34E6|nr:hypothetical protein [uncultured Paludibaculum sp.]
MDSDRKYKQRGYMDTEAAGKGAPQRDDRPRDRGPRPPIDVTGPRLPRMVETVTASRCYNCATPLPPGMDFSGTCPKCSVALHCCKQCSYFEPSTRFQCMKPIPERIAYKDKANECTFFRARVTVARDSAPVSAAARPAADRPEVLAPKTANDARIAFDNLFKK